MRTVRRLWILLLVVGAWGKPQDDLVEGVSASSEAQEVDLSRMYNPGTLVHGIGDEKCSQEGDMLYARFVDECYICACFQTTYGLTTKCASCMQCRGTFASTQEDAVAQTHAGIIASATPLSRPQTIHVPTSEPIPFWPTPMPEPVESKWELPAPEPLKIEWPRPVPEPVELSWPVPVPEPTPEWLRPAPKPVELTWSLPPQPVPEWPRPTPEFVETDWPMPPLPSPEPQIVPNWQPEKETVQWPVPEINWQPEQETIEWPVPTPEPINPAPYSIAPEVYSTQSTPKLEPEPERLPKPLPDIPIECPPPIMIPGPPRPYPVPVPVPGKNIFIPVPIPVPSKPEKIYIRGPSEEAPYPVKAGTHPSSSPQVVTVPVPVATSGNTRYPVRHILYLSPKCKGHRPLVPFRIKEDICNIHICKIIYNYVYIETQRDPECLYYGSGSPSDTPAIAASYTGDYTWPNLQAKAFSSGNSGSFGGLGNVWTNSQANAKANAYAGASPDAWSNSQANILSNANSIVGGDSWPNAHVNVNNGGYPGLFNEKSWSDSHANAFANTNSGVDSNTHAMANAMSEMGSMNNAHVNTNSYSGIPSIPYTQDNANVAAGGHKWQNTQTIANALANYKGTINPWSNSQANANALTNVGSYPGFYEDAWSNANAEAHADTKSSNLWSNAQTSASANANSGDLGSLYGNSWSNSEASAHANANSGSYMTLVGRSENDNDGDGDNDRNTDKYKDVTITEDEEDASKSRSAYTSAQANSNSLAQATGNGYTNAHANAAANAGTNTRNFGVDGWGDLIMNSANAQALANVNKYGRQEGTETTDDDNGNVNKNDNESRLTDSKLKSVVESRNKRSFFPNLTYKNSKLYRAAGSRQHK